METIKRTNTHIIVVADDCRGFIKNGSNEYFDYALINKADKTCTLHHTLRDAEIAAGILTGKESLEELLNRALG